VLVHFWATWCPICRAEQDSIAAIVHDHPNMLTVAMQSGTPEEVSPHRQKQGVDFPVVNDQDGALARAWDVHAVPACLIVGPDGQIRFVETGYTTGVGIRLRLWLAGFWLA
jgi:thiol-disulfide isomerase/thioredoxin